MREAQSPLTRLMERPDFKPFAGPDAFMILKLVKERLEIPPIKQEDILKAISSLGFISEDEIAMMYTLQDKLCKHCCECCRSRNPIIFTKQELKRLSDRNDLSYKKLKQELKAIPRGDGTFRVPGQPCPFLQSNGCEIYQIRPQFCRSYPTYDILKAITNQKPDDMPDCPVTNKIILEIVVKRVFEERLYREDPEFLKGIIDERMHERGRLLDLPPQLRIKYLISKYEKSLEPGKIEELFS